MLFDAVGDMLSDAQLEVRDCASATLAGMIRCSPAPIRNPIIYALKDRFERQLRLNPMPKKKVPGTDTPVDTQKQIVRRHAAVLGLGALIEAFPYATPPPKWMPEVLAGLATRAANDPGVVGKATKASLAEFKKTRQDSWGVDQKVCFFFCLLPSLFLWPGVVVCLDRCSVLWVGRFLRRLSSAMGFLGDRYLVMSGFANEAGGYSTLRVSSLRIWRVCCGRATLLECTALHVA
jgi:hypothetical protein